MGLMREKSPSGKNIGDLYFEFDLRIIQYNKTWELLPRQVRRKGDRPQQLVAGAEAARPFIAVQGNAIRLGWCGEATVGAVFQGKNSLEQVIVARLHPAEGMLIDAVKKRRQGGVQPLEPQQEVQWLTARLLFSSCRFILELRHQGNGHLFNANPDRSDLVGTGGAVPAFLTMAEALAAGTVGAATDLFTGKRIASGIKERQQKDIGRQQVGNGF